MPILVVRHAHAGSRYTWDGDDDAQRPLTAKGQRHAAALVEVLAAHGAPRIVSSPFLRCVQTVQPLAEVTGTDVELDERLAEARPFTPVLELLAELPDGAVVCSHGDVIPDLINALLRRGMTITGEPEWGKGSVWSLVRGDDGGFVQASARPRPD